MATTVKNVTNQQVLDALTGMGVVINGPVDMTGAQNDVWERKMLPLIERSMPPGQQYSADVFRQAVQTAKTLAGIPADASPMDKLTQTLQAYGITGQKYTDLVNEAARIARSTPGIRQAGQPFSESDYLQAAANILGNTPFLRQAASRAGMQIPAPAPDSPAAKAAAPAPMPIATPPPAPGPAEGALPSTGLRGYHNTPAQPSAPPGGAAGPGTAGAPGGGGPNNTPPGPATWNDDQIKDFIKSNFGSNAYFVDIPEVWDALKSVVKAGKGPAGLEPALEGTQFWKQNAAAARSWFVKERADPAQAASDIAQQGQAVTNLAQQMGITIDPARVQSIAQSYLRYGWTQTDLQRAISAEWHYDPSSKNQAAAVSKMKQDARNWLVPLSDQAVQTWGSGLMSGTTTDAQWQQYLRDSAKSMLPQLAGLIDAHQGDPSFTVDHFVDPYRTLAAQTLGTTTDQIDFTDPKWRRALDQVDPKTNQRRIMTLGEWQSTLKTDPGYGYDKTANGIQDGVNLAQQLKQSMGLGA